MVRKSFAADITNGQLCFHESLSDLEGHRVMVLIDDLDGLHAPATRLSPQPFEEEIDSIEDVNFVRPFLRRRVSAVVQEGGKLRPCLILPEGDADE